MTIPRAYGARTALLALLATAACTDRSPTGPGSGGATPGGEPGGPTTTIAELTCTADREAGSVSCVPATPGVGEASGIIVGNQGVYVQLTSTNVNYDSGTGQFTFDATLQNLIEQPLGTTDGTSQDPTGIRIFFHELPTAVEGTGNPAVVPDGFAFFTQAAQPYYNYPYLLEQTEVSAAERWTFVVPPTVTRFVFSVFVSAPVQFPTGYITLNGELPGAAYGPLHPSTPVALTAVVKNAVGAVLPGTVTFATTNPDCAQVNGTGTVTGIQAATCSITATSGALTGELIFSVTGTSRTWNGSLSTAWATPGNWDGGRVPVAADSVVVPDGTPNDPVLSADTDISGVNVADGATLSLGTNTLRASADVITGLTVGSGILGTTGVLELAGGTEAVRGRVPNLLVTGTYTLSGDLHVVAPGRIVSGRVRNVGHLLRMVAQ